MEKISLKRNASLNGVRTVFAILFPLITFPYATRVLQVANLGKVNFSSSIVNYFLLMAGLGVATYAIREGAGLRNDPEKLNEFGNQVFTINLISTVISYLFLFTVLFTVPSLADYRLLLLIQSMSIIFTTVGVEWIYSIYEDYLFITLRSLAFQVLSLILLFVLVKDTEDYYLYALITVISTVGSNIINYVHSRKYTKLRLTRHLGLKKHLKPILIIFSNNILSTFYVNSDITLLGFMEGNYSVGIYSVAVKVYTTVKSVLAAVIIVAIPRLSFYLANNQMENYRNTVNKVFNYISILILPSVVGINLLSEELVIILSGGDYLEAAVSLRILSVALLFSIYATVIVSLILLPMKLEKYILKATLASAILNVGLNLIMIPAFQEKGAALTTAIAELLVLLMSYYYAKDHIQLKGIFKNIGASLVGCVALAGVAFVLRSLISNVILFTCATAGVGAAVYFLIMLALKNEAVLEVAGPFLSKFRNKKG